MNRILSFLAGVFAGSLVGAVAALLLAPASGAELRADAEDRFDHLWYDARAAAEAKRKELEAQLKTLKGESDHA